jgi:hypothetical protein
MKLPCFLLLVVGLMTPTLAWFSGDGGLVMWDNNCGWRGYAFATKPSLAEQCGGICIATSGCRKFDWKDGICHLRDDEQTLGTYEGKNFDGQSKLLLVALSHKH